MAEIFWLLSVPVISYITILHIIINRKVKQVKNYTNVIQNFASKVESIHTRLKTDDRLKEAFESDDDIGWYFSEINNLTAELYQHVFESTDSTANKQDG